MSNSVKTKVTEQDEHKRVLKKLRCVTAAVTLSVILLLSLLIAAMLFANSKKIANGDHLREKIAASSKNIDVNGAVLNLYYREVYLTFKDCYGDMLEYLGFDPDISAKKQKISDTASWFDYFMEAARDNLSRSLVLCEAAAEDGIALSEAELEAIKKHACDTDAGMYQSTVNSEDIYTARTLDALAYKYQLITEAEFTPTEAETDAYYADEPRAFQLVDYYAFSLCYGTESDGGAYTEAEIASIASELAALENENAFMSAVGALLFSETPNISEADMDKKLSSLIFKGMTYSEDDPLSEWAYSAKAGDTFVSHSEEDAVYTVYMLTAEPYRSEAPTVTVRHILLADDTYGSRDNARTKAEELLSRIEAENMTDDLFSLLVLEYSQDLGSYYRGGMYSNITEGQMPEGFDEWCFDPKRRSGDLGIVETELGVHVIRFEAHGAAKWRADVSDRITDGRFEEYLKTAAEKHTVIFDETVTDMIPG